MTAAAVAYFLFDMSGLLSRAISAVFPTGRSERVYFDEAFYTRTYDDIAAAGVDPFQHYMTHGWREGRRPSSSFDTLYYRDQHLDGVEINPLTHFVAAGGEASGLATIAPSAQTYAALQRRVVSAGFDIPYYTLQTGLLEQDPILHYLETGWRAGRSPAPTFDVTRYCTEHAFVETLGVAPFYHYASQERMKRRGAARSDTPRIPRERILATIRQQFDSAHYLKANRDVRDAGLDPLAHYIDHGWREDRDPTPLFHSAYYRAANPETEGQNPYHHYLTIGRRQGRRANPVGTRLYPPLRAPSDAQWSAATPAADTAAATIVVIMPVYKGYEETLAAIHAVLKAPQKAGFALHVIDDRSPDSKLAAKLGELAARGLFSFARNPANIGFVKTVNRGLRAFRDKEIVLLNADAIVSGDWLDRLARHAKGDPSIATITPLSNNATICSYPKLNANNLIEPEVDAATLDRLAATCNAGRASDVPTGVGFCLWMSRESRVAVGFLDEAAFGRGYGEENDFCLRAAKAGFRNVMAEDIFVYHAGEVSFAGIGVAEYGAAQTALNAKHPDYTSRVRQHLRADPGEIGRMRLDLFRLARATWPAPVVFVSHALSGGIVTHIRHMETRLREEGIGVVHLRVGVGDRWSVEISSDAPGAPFCPNIRATSLSRVRTHLEAFLGWLKPRAIHIHSLVGFDWQATIGLFDLVRNACVPWYVTLHDYSVVCHRHDLVPPDGRFCGLPGIDTCRACVAADRAYPEALDPAVRRRTWDAFLQGAASVFAPSEDIRTRLLASGAPYAITLRPHEDTRTIVPAHVRQKVGPGIDVVSIGAIGLHKGSRIILDLARDARARGLPIRFHIVGFSDSTEELAGLGVTETGRFETDEAAAALVAAIAPNYVLLPSIWPETYCFALSLAFDLAIPPVVFDIGAQAARVRDARYGIVLPYALIDDLGALNDRLLKIDRRNVGLPPPRSAQPLYASLAADYYGWERPSVASDDTRAVVQ